MKIIILIKDSNVGHEVFEHLQNLVKDFFPEEGIEFEVVNDK